MNSNRFDLVVVGAGIAGLTAAAAGADRGLRVCLVGAGFGSFVSGAGCLANQPLESAEHPELLDDAVGFFRKFASDAGCPFQGEPGRDGHLPTMLGTFQTVSLAPLPLWNGEASVARRTVVVGIAGVSSFDAGFVAERLNFHAGRLGLPSTYSAREIALSGGSLSSAPLHLANRFDRDPAFRRQLVDLLRPIAGEAELIILPGILGQRSRWPEIARLEEALDCRLCELPTVPPSVPGLRLSHALTAQLRRVGVELLSGFPATGLDCAGRQCRAVLVDTPARPRRLEADAVILATGQFSRSLVPAPWVGFDDRLCPITEDGGCLADNLFLAGAILPGAGHRGGNQRAILGAYRAALLAAERGGRHAH